jgi:hypothetical protein
MDTETEKWPIPSKHKEEFESLKFDFIACPLYDKEEGRAEKRTRLDGAK